VTRSDSILASDLTASLENFYLKKNSVPLDA